MDRLSQLAKLGALLRLGAAAGLQGQVLPGGAGRAVDRTAGVDRDLRQGHGQARQQGDGARRVRGTGHVAPGGGGPDAIAHLRDFFVVGVVGGQVGRGTLPDDAERHRGQRFSQRFGAAHIKPRANHRLRAEGQKRLLGAERGFVAFQQQAAQPRDGHRDLGVGQGDGAQRAIAQRGVGFEQALDDRQAGREVVQMDGRIVIDDGRHAGRDRDRQRQQVARQAGRHRQGAEPAGGAAQMGIEVGGEGRRRQAGWPAANAQFQADAALALGQPQHR